MTAPAEFWEQHYRAKERIWSGRPNAVLVTSVEGLAPGRALDLGCGEGADAVWLAARGWDVTAVDISATAVSRTAAAAAAAGVHVRAERHDLSASLPQRPYDLVSAQFLQSPVELPRAHVLRRAAGTVAVGGLLLVVEHAAAPPWAPPGTGPLFPTPQDTYAALELPSQAWEVLRVETVARQAAGPDGQPGDLLDGVVAVRRVR